METKGVALISLKEFVQHKFPDRFEEWLSSLSKDSQEIMGGAVLASAWYPLNLGLAEPTQRICDLFYHGTPQGAWEAGRFSAEHALKGIYKLFIRVCTPGFLVAKSTTLLNIYYRPIQAVLVAKDADRGVVHVTKFPEPDLYVEHRIGGWIERALELTGSNGIRVVITESLAKGGAYTEYIGSWK